MQHIWEFLAVPKPTPEEIKPEPINRYYITETSRKSKATSQMYKSLKDDYEKLGLKKPMQEQDLENFFVRQIR